MKNVLIGLSLLIPVLITTVWANELPQSFHTNTNGYPIVDSGQYQFYGNDEEIAAPAVGGDFYGQDASYIINPASYTDNSDGTITDNVTGLMWQKDMGDKLTYEEALKKVNALKLAGHVDWRVANIKELYSLIQFNGKVKGQRAITPFIDTLYFNQPIGDTEKGDREIDAQTWSGTEYVGRTMRNDETVFGVNFVDGRIKGYPKYNPRSKAPNKMFFRFVRGNKTYGENSFVDNGDGTVLDLATGLVWQKSDSGKGMAWKEALSYSESLELAGHDDWRLPSAKELQSIVDYSRSPETSNSPAIDPIFETSSINNEGGEKDYPYYWTSTTHLDGPIPESHAVYISFGKALGEINGKVMDVHGAGSQRSDPKTGKPGSRGPQGDMLRINNYVRSVRGGVIAQGAQSTTKEVKEYTSDSKKSSHIEDDSSVASRFISRHDKNGDNKVSVSEFKGPANHFSRFDKNGDGFITESEAPKNRPKNRKKD